MSRMEDGKLVESGGGSRVKSEWENIELELLMKIVSLLDDRTVIVASGVCSRWRNVICSELTRISLSWCTNNINNLALSLVPKFTNLRILTLRKKDESLLDNKSVQAIAKNCHDLKDLDLSMNSRLGDRCLYALARGCPNLTKLNISRCSAFRDQGLEFLSSYCRKLKILNLFGCYKAVTNKALKAIGDNCRQLESINLGLCYKVGDAGVKHLANGCPDLNAIDLGQCFDITDESVIALASNCIHLTNLNISYCKALTAPVVQALCDSFPALHTCQGRRSLIMDGCSNLTSVHCAYASQPHCAILPA